MTIFILVSLAFVTGCNASTKATGKTGVSTEPKKEVLFIPEKELPKKVVVLLPFPVGDVKMDEHFRSMLRGVVQNYLSAKGYKLRYSDKLPPKLARINAFDPQKVFKTVKDVDGVFVVLVHSFSGVNALFVKNYSLDAELCLYKKGKKLGCWRDSVSRRSVSVSTDPLGIAAQIVGAVLSDSTTTKMKTLIMEWSYNVSALVPGFSKFERKPKIFRVITNVSDKPFKLGDRIVVAVEGDPSMEARFDIGTFKRDIPMVESTKPGIYQGVYVVQKGDEVRNQYIVVRLINERGDKSEWLELEPPVNIDGVPPEPPRDVSFRLKDVRAVELSWKCTDGTTKSFRIYRSEHPLSGYQLLSETYDLNFVDTKVIPGKTYYYRIVAVDDVGNESAPKQVGPVELPVTGVSLNGTLNSDIDPGEYHVVGIVEIPSGVKVQVKKGAILKVKPDGGLKVCGKLMVEGEVLPVNGTWRGIEVCPGGSLVVHAGVYRNAKYFKVQGKATFKEVTFVNGDSLKVTGDSKAEFMKCTFKDLKKGLVVDGGEVKIEECNFRNNGMALYVREGSVLISKTNFINNDWDIVNEKGEVVLKENYLGTSDPTAFKIRGRVHLVSYLTFPYPEGSVVKYDPEKLRKEGEEALKKGIEQVKKGNYGKALEYLERAYKLNKTKEVYYWLVYVYTMMEEEGKLKKVIGEALQNYPYEVNIYQLAIRYYIFKGKYHEAKSLLDRALKLQPNNPSLESMKALIESMKPNKNEKEVANGTAK
ncbi:hypothetical protein TST_0555 [Thermosulfidibacter takaii ABI70S6]|uniref:Fibronectin type-III domain-containing protein n=1 Tax=Thermosulfidibacter takaii (strain DSM 17441 / JCM 13301 / NBRC 103674 / ABI70S6) TaxID=1298851 RepID=A0A0S3QSW1_THET7|nr:hypothetical protein TST_0555 [Thermosulfidibacter takaii ABI70S6]